MASDAVINEDIEYFGSLEDASAFMQYLAGPHSIGLDKLKLELRNMVLYMMELQGYDYGYLSSVLQHDEHESLAMDGPSLSKKGRKKRKRKSAQEELAELDRILERSYDEVYAYVSQRIAEVRDNIQEEVNKIDSEIETLSRDSTQAEQFKAADPRRNLLLHIKQRLDQHEQDLQSAELTTDVIALHQKVEKKIDDLNSGTYQPDNFKTSISFIQAIAAAIARHVEQPIQVHTPPKRRVNQINLDLYGFDPDLEETDGKDEKTGSTGKSGKGDKTDDDIPPPSPLTS